MFRSHIVRGALAGLAVSLAAGLVAGSAAAFQRESPPPTADLQLALGGLPHQVGIGGTVTFAAAVRNRGPAPATNVVLTETLPAGTTFVSSLPSQGSCSGSGPVSCTLGTLASGATATATVVVTATAAGRPVVTAQVAATETDPSPGDNQRSVATTVRGATADLRLDLVASPHELAAGGNVTYTARVRNAGPDAASGVTLVDTLPAKTTLVSATASQGSCTGSGPVSCALGALPSGASATATIVAATTVPGRLLDQAQVSATERDPSPENARRSVSTLVRGATADLHLSLDRRPSSVTVGGSVTYTAVVRNDGPDQATGVTLANALPDRMTFVSASASQGSCTGTGSLSCSLGTLAKGASATVTFVATAARSGWAVDTARVASAERDPSPRDARRSVSTLVRGPTADLDLRLSGSRRTVTTGQTVVYTATVRNAGPDTATNVTLVESLPAKATFVSVSASQGTCSGTTTLTCPLGTLAKGASATVVVTVVARRTGWMTDSARVRATEQDRSPRDLRAAVSTRVRSPKER